MTTGLCSPSDGAPLTEVSGGMDGGIDGKGNSDGGGTRNVEFHGALSKKSSSQAMNVHPTAISNQPEGTNNNNNNSTTLIEPDSRLHQEKHESKGETSGSDRIAKQNINVEPSKPTEATT